MTLRALLKHLEKFSVEFPELLDHEVGVADKPYMLPTPITDLLVKRDVDNENVLVTVIVADPEA
jgi:hypothetical protein